MTIRQRHLEISWWVELLVWFALLLCANNAVAAVRFVSLDVKPIQPPHDFQVGGFHAWFHDKSLCWTVEFVIQGDPGEYELQWMPELGWYQGWLTVWESSVKLNNDRPVTVSFPTPAPGTIRDAPKAGGVWRLRQKSP